MIKAGLIEKQEKTTDNKFINLYKLHYAKPNGKKFVYEVCSRRSLENLEVNNPKQIVDAVKILPYFYENGTLKICLISEFRHAINRYVYGLPAGLVDEGEQSVESAARELEEEIGAEVISIEKTETAAFSSVGLTDECLELFEAEVKLTKEAKLEDFEDIKLKIVNFDDINAFLSKNEVDLPSKLQIRAFYYKQLLNLLKKTN